MIPDNGLISPRNKETGGEEKFIYYTLVNMDGLEGNIARLGPDILAIFQLAAYLNSI